MEELQKYGYDPKPQYFSVSTMGGMAYVAYTVLTIYYVGSCTRGK